MRTGAPCVCDWEERAAPTWPDDMNLYAISDLHVRHSENRDIMESLRPQSDNDWLLIAGDVGENFDDVVWAMSFLRERFAKVVWAPGNHELWSPPRDLVDMRGEKRYLHLVDTLRGLGVVTPEDPYPVWEGRRRAAVRPVRLHVPAGRNVHQGRGAPCRPRGGRGRHR
jgi:hypothetical protein